MKLIPVIYKPVSGVHTLPGAAVANFFTRIGFLREFTKLIGDNTLMLLADQVRLNTHNEVKEEIINRLLFDVEYAKHPITGGRDG